MAQGLLFQIVNPQNLNSIIKELLNLLLVESDPENCRQLSEKICYIVSEQCQDGTYCLDVMLKVFAMAGNSSPYVSEIVHLVNLV